MATEFAEEHRGGGFNPIEPTTRGGRDYGRFVEAVRTMQDHARAADAPDEVITQAADLLEAASELLAPYDADEWSSPSGRRMDLPNRGSVLGIPADYHKTDDGRVGGTAQFRRFHLGRNGAVHGGVHRAAIRLAARLHRLQAHAQPLPAHRVLARRLPQDRADRDETAGRRRCRPCRRPQDVRRGTAARRGGRAGRSQRAVREAATRGSREAEPVAGRAGATGCGTAPAAEFGYRIVVAVIGLAVLGVGILAIPYPGPGWAIVFVGLGDPGHRIRLGAAAAGLRQGALRQGDGLVPAAGHVGADARCGVFTALIVVVATLWLLGALDWSAELVGVEQPVAEQPYRPGD